MNLVKFALISTILLTGCATTATPESRQTDVPEARNFVKSQSRIAPYAKVIVVRDEGAKASLNYLHFSVNGMLAASFNPGERLELSLPAGDYVLGVKPTDPFGMHTGYNIDQSFVSGKTYLYRLLIDGNSARIERTSSFTNTK